MFSILTNYYTEFWIIVGFILILLEFITIPGIGFLFIGLGCLSTAVMLYTYPSLIEYQIASVALFSFFYLIVLWLPFNKLIRNSSAPKKNTYSDLLGKRVKVSSSNLNRNDIGTVYWSGTMVNARLADDQEQGVKSGEFVYIVAVEGNVLICSVNPLMNSSD